MLGFARTFWHKRRAVPRPRKDTMKGVILAGGTGSRLFPLTKVTNKHLLPVGREPMIFHPVKKLTEAGIDEILMVTGVEHMGDVVNLLGSGKDFGCRFTYKVQDEAGGIAQALGLAEDFAGRDLMCVILGDNIFQDPIAPFVRAFREQARGARLLLKQVHDPQRYGVAEVEGSRVVRIVEKPKEPKSDLAVVGVYFYDADVFGIIRSLKPSARGELEITDVNNHYLRNGALHCDRLQGWWTDAGTFDSLHAASELVTGRAQSALEAERR
jgi:glucose-1-phosphate thymidylyltransferase